MNRLVKFLPLIAAASLGTVSAETATSQPAGFVKIACPANSDTIVSVPFHRPAVFTGIVDSAPATANGDTTFDVNGTPNFTDNTLAGSHYVRLIGASTHAGRVFEISANTASGITITGADGFVSEDDQLKIIPHWTLDALFPPGTQDTIHASASLLPTDRQTRVLFFDSATEGIDLAPSRIFFLTTKWVEMTGQFPDAGDTVIPPGSTFVIRHPDSVAATNFIPHQFVEMGPATTVLPVGTSARDVALSVDRPVPVKLSELDLETVFTESASTDQGDRADELHIFDNSVAAVNKQPSAVYFRTGGEWREDTAGFPNADDDTVSPAAGIVIRKAAAGAAGSAVWVNTPRF